MHVLSRRGALALTILLSLPSALLAQAGTIAGKVTDRATQMPLADARLIIPGTALETQTNREGVYRITNVPAGRVSVGVLRLGYKAQSDTVRVIAGQTTTLNFVMTASLVTLSEVVVTGTAGNQERRAQSAQVASVNAAELVKQAPISNVGELLQSRVPGVAVSSNSGTAGTAKSIRIRGSSSINLSNQPLLFIDGIRVNEGIIASGQSGQSFDRLNDINPDEIESIEVVKGPAAATLYGADASAGVIQIITKKGRPGSNRFTQDVRLEGGQIDQRWTPPDNYANCTATTVAATSTNPLCRGQAVGTLVSDNPLVRVGAFRTGSDRQIGWNGRGGGQNYGYNLSYGSQRTLGTLPNNDFQRYNVRSNFNYVPDSRLTFDAGLGLAQTKTGLPDNDNNIYGWLGGALLGSPSTRSDAAAPSRDGWYAFNRHYNAIKSIDHSQLTHRVTSTLAANYVPLSWFTNRFTVGMDYAQDEQQNFYPKNDSTWYGGARDGGEIAQFSRGAERYTFDYLGNVRRTFGVRSEWESNLSGGLQVISSRNKIVSATGLGLVTNANNSINSAATTTGGSLFTEQRQFGYIGQAQLGYENRAFVQVGVRIDKNSSFGATSPAFVLPKVGATWTISEESFFAPLTPYVNTLRLRGAWGTTGRSPQPGDALTTLVAAPYNITGTTTFAGAIPGNPGNDSLKAERGEEYEFGGEASFWNDRISTDITYFHKVTKDLIIALPIAPSLGFNANPLANIGSVLNSGIEMSLNVSALRTRYVDWDIRAGANTLHNELTDLGGYNSFNLNGQRNRAFVGEQVGVFMSKKIQSIDVAKSIVTVSDTLVPIANLLPTFEWNLTNSFTIAKHLRITTLLDAKRNFSVYNNTEFFRETQLVRSNRRLDPSVLPREEFLRRYGDDTPGRPAFVTVSGAAAGVNDVYEAYIQPGDIVRLRELSATYDLPTRFIASMGNKIQGASLTFAMQNVKLWTNYGGADPEVVSNPNNLGGGFSRDDFLTLPNPRTTLLRLNLTF